MSTTKHKQETVLIDNIGFKIEKLTNGDIHEPTGARFAYELKGPRSSWLLIRNKHDKELLFGVNKKTGKQSPWFVIERRGHLTQVEVDSL